jgi:iron complex transport system ATP-binding protein
MPLIECRDLSCGYPNRTVLSGLNLYVEAGESVALLGVNGSGKSTLIRTLSRLQNPLSGQLTLCGDDPSKLSMSELAKRVATVPQDEPTTFPFLVREMVTMGRVSYGTHIFDTAGDREKASEAMRVAGCEDLADRPITQLSGGERQRVWIARAIAQDTPIVLMDEPTSHLDVSHQLATASLARKLAKQGKCVISAVHDLNLAPSMADRAILIDEGRIAADDRTTTVLESEALDKAYRVRFERTRTASGRFMVSALS